MSETKRKPRYITSYMGVKDDIFMLSDMNSGKYYSNIVHAISEYVCKDEETIDEVILQKRRDELIAYMRLVKHGRIHARFVKAFIVHVNKLYCSISYQERITKEKYNAIFSTWYYYQDNRN